MPVDLDDVLLRVTEVAADRVAVIDDHVDAEAAVDYLGVERPEVGKGGHRKRDLLRLGLAVSGSHHRELVMLDRRVSAEEDDPVVRPAVGYRRAEKPRVELDHR